MRGPADLFSQTGRRGNKLRRRSIFDRSLVRIPKDEIMSWFVRLIVLVGGLPLALLSSPAIAADNSSPTRPNIVVILSDDQGWGDLSVHGNKNLSTPNIDSIARDGALFDRFYVCPVCSPTRCEFLTGRYHPRGGIWSTSSGGERLNLDEKTIGDTFKAAGYATAAYGKWHNGAQYPYHPNARGFDDYYGFCSGHWGDYFNPPLEHNGDLVRGNGFIIDDLADHAIEFIAKHRSEPFFCYVPFNTPHTPLQVPDQFYDKFAKADLPMRADPPAKGAGKGAGKGNQEDLAKTRAVMAMCENIDWNVGRILAKLDELKLADNTIVLYFCDNGPNTHRWNGGMKGRKGSTDEGGVRSPLVIRWPGKIPAGTQVRQISGAIDLLPTLASLAGVRVVSEKPLDGRDISPLLTGSAPSLPDRMIFSHWAGKVSVRTQQYRLDMAGKLFDMVKDPGQKSPITDQPEVAARLQAAVESWTKELVAPLATNEKDVRPFPVGYRQFPITWLPARDAVESGTIERSSKAPNCSYFTHWTSPDDRITWDVEVATTGRYEAVVYYTCPASDVGSTIELSFGDAKVSAPVTVAHDPPLRGKEHDRASRDAESYVKDFAPLQLGVVELKQGRGPLTLRAPKIVGKQAIDMRTVWLKLID
jgi:arylsulfatase A-like enzyme